ncbi:hypothetical protein [Novosphingobium sp. PhB165]|uniref:hypothetical protein n=1 Tax=Novosphingobium sp. PhB165 TaxID=2485105 RepID=UPI0014043CD1|nr:hypothetical protein [Novosphingobium sp. PhB165]
MLGALLAGATIAATLRAALPAIARLRRQFANARLTHRVFVRAKAPVLDSESRAQNAPLAFTPNEGTQKQRKSKHFRARIFSP